MFKAIKRWWKYLTAKVNSSFNEKADPKIQLEQAITEAQEQHRRLKEQAANVIANQKQTELRLNRAMEELEKVNGNARQAVLMADEAAKKGDATKATEYTSTPPSPSPTGSSHSRPRSRTSRRCTSRRRRRPTRPRRAVQQNSTAAPEEARRSASASSASSTRRRCPSR